MLADIKKADERTMSATRAYLGLASRTTRERLRAFGRGLSKDGVVKGKMPEPDIIARVRADWDAGVLGVPPAIILDGIFPGYMEAYKTAIERFNSGHWRRVAWIKEGWFKDKMLQNVHFAHASTENPGSIAFADSIDKLIRDRFTVMKPGRYLQRYYADVLDEAQIKDYANQFSAAFVHQPLQFIAGDDKDGWVRVYEDGPRSCMQGEDSVHVYAHEHSVLRLAYQITNGQIVSRAIVREDRKEYIRIYPTDEGVVHGQMQAALEAAGYTHGNLNGVYLDAVDHDHHDGWVCPYLDSGRGGDTNVDNVVREVDGCKHFYLWVGHGSMDGQTQNGYVYLGRQCDECEEHYDEDALHYVESEEREVCEHCLDRHYVLAYIGRHDQEYFHEDSGCIYCDDTNEYYRDSEVAARHDVYQCEESGDYFESSNLYSTSRGLIHHRFCVELAVEDSDGNTYAHKRDTVTTHDGRVIHEDDAVLRTVYFHKDDDIDNDQTPDNTASQAA